MPTHTIPLPELEVPAGRSGGWWRAVRAFIERSRAKAARRETLRVLAQLDPERLADIGLTRATLREAFESDRMGERPRGGARPFRRG